MKTFLFKVLDSPEKKLYFLLSDEKPVKGDWIFDTESLGWDKFQGGNVFEGCYKIIMSTSPMLDKSLPVMEIFEPISVQENKPFEITIKSKIYECPNMWNEKRRGVILVEKEEDIEKLWKLLCEQDDYWEEYKELIQVAPKEINSNSDFVKMCQYVGKTDIYDVKKIKEQVMFYIYQEDEWQE